jgi:putative SOS response-associated peptidase YedK
MCGRYSASGNLDELTKLIDYVSRGAFLAPRYNVAPRQLMPVIVLEHYQPVMKLMRWGLIPSWAKEASIGDKLINARAETLAEKASFRYAYHHQRCLIPADGFYEWQRQDKSFTPFRFTMRDQSYFCMAGLWERWIEPAREGEFNFNDLDEPSPSRVVESFTVITTSANPMVSRVHDRMPVILSPQDWLRWIDCERNKGDDVYIRYMLKPYPAEDMDCYRVSKLVNSAANDNPEVMKPA